MSCNRRPRGADEQLTVKINHPVAKGRGRILDCVPRDTLNSSITLSESTREHVANGVEITVALGQKYHLLFPFLGKLFLYQNTYTCFPAKWEPEKAFTLYLSLLCAYSAGISGRTLEVHSYYYSVILFPSHGMLVILFDDLRGTAVSSINLEVNLFKFIWVFLRKEYIYAIVYFYTSFKVKDFSVSPW